MSFGYCPSPLLWLAAVFCVACLVWRAAWNFGGISWFAIDGFFLQKVHKLFFNVSLGFVFLFVTGGYISICIKSVCCRSAGLQNFWTLRKGQFLHQGFTYCTSVSVVIFASRHSPKDVLWLLKVSSGGEIWAVIAMPMVVDRINWCCLNK